MALNGIDVSSYQADLNLGNITYDFVAIKVSQGGSYVNPHCDAHFQQAQATGKKIAVYHYADGGDAVAEADFFVNNAAGYIGKAMFALDWEGNGVEYTDWALRFLKRVEERIGYKPVIYMSEYVENTFDWSAVVANNNGLWIAKYSDYEIDNNYDMGHAGNQPGLRNWPFYCMWQWTSKGRLNGYAGDLDCNIFYGDAGVWDAYAGYVPPTTTTTTETPVTTTTTTEEPFITETTTEAPVFTTTELPEPTTTTTLAVDVPAGPGIWSVIWSVVIWIIKRLQGVQK